MKRCVFALVLLVCVCCCTSVRASDDFALLVETPGESVTVRSPVPLVEVRGHLRTDFRDSDVMVAIDLSESAFLPCGYDADADGHVGRLRRTRRAGGSLLPERLWTTDFDDTLAAASLRLASDVIRTLERDGTRVGVLSFAGRPRVHASPGPPERARAALASLRLRRRGGGTDLAAATRVGVRALLENGSPERKRFLLILSDGVATRPAPRVHARSAALRAARWAAKSGVTLIALAPTSADPDEEALLEMTGLTGGRVERLAAARPDILKLVGIQPGRLAQVRIFNRTSNAEGRAVRVRRDGSFDGFVPVVPGANQLEIRARTSSGREQLLRRTIRFERGEGDPASFYAALQARTLETVLAARAREGARRRSLVIRADADSSPAAPANSLDP